MPGVSSYGSPPLPQAAVKETCKEHLNAETCRVHIHKAGNKKESQNSTQTSTDQAFPRNAQAPSTVGDGPTQRTCRKTGCQGKPGSDRRPRGVNIGAPRKIALLLDGGILPGACGGT